MAHNSFNFYRIELFTNVVRNDGMSAVYRIQRRPLNEIKEFTQAANNEFEALSVSFVIRTTVKT